MDAKSSALPKGVCVRGLSLTHHAVLIEIRRNGIEGVHRIPGPSFVLGNLVILSCTIICAKCRYYGLWGERTGEQSDRNNFKQRDKDEVTTQRQEQCAPGHVEDNTCSWKCICPVTWTVNL